MGLRFVIGGSGAGKSYYVYRNMIEQSIKHPETNYLIVVPDQFTLQTQLDIVNMHPNKGIMNIDVLSFGRLSHRIFEEVGGNDKPVLDDTGKNLVLRKVAEDYKEQLTTIKNNIRRTGYISEVKSAISEFMQYGIGTEDMDELLEYTKEKSILHNKLKDISTLYKGFHQYINERFITTEETLDILSKVLDRSRVVKNSVIVFDGFTGFTPVQNRVIQKLMVLASEVILTITMDAEENPYKKDEEQKLFYLSKKTIADLSKLAEEAGVKREKDIILNQKPVYRLQHNKGLAHLEQELFRYRGKSFNEEQDSIYLSEMSTPREEIRQIALQIRDLIRKAGYAYRDIAVVTGDLSRYSHFVEEEFAKFQIPFFLDQTNGIILNPFTEFIRSALLVADKDFSYESVFHFLRCGLLDVEPEEVDRLENYVLALGIRGKKAWSERFTRRTGDMVREVDELEALEKLRVKIVDWLMPLLFKKGTAEQFVKALYEFIVNADIQRKLWVYAQQFQAEGELQKAKEYEQIYPLVCDLLDQIIGLLGSEELSLKEFAEILDAGFSEIEVGTIPQNVDRVVVGDIERTRLKKIKALFFIGINDGIIPKSGGTGGIISDIDREFLQESKWEFAPTPRQQMFIQRLYLYMNMTKPSEKLFLSYAKVDSAGKTLRPAYLVDMVKKMYPGLQVQKPQLRPLALQIDNRREGMDYFIALLRSYGSGMLTDEAEKKVFFTLYQDYQENELYHDIVNRLTDIAFYQYQQQILPQEIARELYGRLLKNSVSRLEKYASCAYAHFLQYGLQLKERDKYRFEQVDMGNIFHAVLEGFSEKLEEEGLTWFDFTKEDGDKLLNEVLENYATEYGATILHSSKRNLYVIQRMKRILNRTIQTLQYQLKQGVFKPEHFELSFQMADQLESVNIALSEDEKMRIIGRIDRVDTYAENDNIYVKIIDYKSGNKKFDLAALYYGLQLQLVVYMNAAMEVEKRQHPDKNIIPAAMLYYHVEDPMTETNKGTPTAEEINHAILEELRMTGMVNDREEVVHMLDTDFETKSDIVPVAKKKDGSYTAASSVLREEDFHTISKYMNQKIKEIGRSILDGDIALNPYEQGNQKACTYCQYASVCGFDSKLAGYQMRKLDDISQEEALKRMEQETE